MDLGISGKRAAVAASSSGLGLAAARVLAQDGVRVAICGRDEARLAAATAELGQVGDVTGFVRTGLFAIGGKNGAIGLNRIEIMAQHRSGHVETLLGKTMHAVVGW